MFKYQAPNPFLDQSSGSFSQSIGRLVLPAQKNSPKVANLLPPMELIRGNDIALQYGLIETHDKAVLDTVVLQPNSNVGKSSSEQHYILKFNGNNGFYQDSLHTYVHEVKELGVTIVGFNYRGVDCSQKTPTCFHDLVTDGIAQVQRLLDSGVDSKKITLDGFSLGGAVATLVASYFHKNGKPVYLWNDRSFASLSGAALGIVEIQTIGLLSTLAILPVWGALTSAKWEVSVVQAYLSIPDEYKAHAYIAKKSECSLGDGVIADTINLHHSVKIDEKKRGVNTGYKMYAQNTLFGRGHNRNRIHLTSADNPDETAEDVFVNFMRRHIG